MNSLLYQRLISIASAKSTVNYADLGNFLGLEMSNPEDRYRLGAMLDDINRVEHSAGRPMLSAVVVHKDDGLPGAGFFECARAFSVLTARDRLAELTFFVTELQSVYSHWDAMRTKHAT